MSAENIHIAGRYNKYLRNLSQSPWIDKDDVRVKDSVQELIEDGLREYLKFEKLTFASSGREDVDVRMLGRGRPFTFKIQSPQFLADYNAETLKKIQHYVNSKHSGKVRIRDLQFVTKSDITKYMTETLEFKQKEYRALCCCTRKLSDEDVEKINSITNLVIQQLTPIRVLHRRTWATRERTVYQMRIEAVKVDEFDSLRPEHLDRVFALILTTEAGTYIKEFVHGDFGRTEPNISSLLGSDCETDLMELDVMEVYSDWPPELEEEQTNDAVAATSDIEMTSLQNQDDKGDNNPQELADLYSAALESMQEAETKPRGDQRQGLYLKARHLFNRSLVIAESLSLFSENETVDDIATADLKYLLIPAYLAKIYTSAECGPDRLETFYKARNQIINFLRRIALYRIGGDAVEKALRNSLSDDKDPQAGIFSEPATTSLETAMRQREEKIRRLREAKLLEERLVELEILMKKGGEGRVDDEVVREYHLKLIKKTIDDMLETLEREVEPAIYLEKNRAAGAVNESPRSSTVPRSHPIKPITIVRDQLQKQVFGAGYPSKPTVTVDEFISKKITDGNLAFDKHKEIYANSLQKYAEQPNLRRDQEEMSDDEHDQKEDRHDEEELRRKRNWDEFKDENPRGSGNRQNMG